MMAADISGIKFTDLTGNGFSVDDTPLAGVSIQLFQDGGDGVFDGVDDTLIDTQATAAVTGAYTFSNVDDGTYFIREIAPVGYTQTAGPAFYKVQVVGNQVFAGNSFTIDDFSLPDPGSGFRINLVDPNPTLIKNTVASGVLGGQRDMLVQVSGASGLNSAVGSVGVSGGQGIFRGTFSIPGSTTTFQYDGLDADVVGPPASLVDAQGLTSDLTNGGVNTGFRFDFVSLDVGSGSSLNLAINLTGPGGETATFTGTITEDLNPFAHFIPFASFTASGGFSFANVTSVNVIINPPGGGGVVAPNVDLILEGITTDRVQPDSFNFGNFPAAPAITLDKIVFDPDCVANIDGSGNVPFFQPGDTVTYQYTIDNTGTIALLVNLVDVADNGTPLNFADDINSTLIVNGVAQPGVIITGDTDNDNLLDPDETWVVTATAAVNTLGYNTNVASVVGTPVDGSGRPITALGNVSAVDFAQVYVATAGINLEKRVNSKDANVPDFDHVPIGVPVNYTYLVTNTGNVALVLSNFIDDNGTPANLADDFTPMQVLVGAFNIGDVNQNQVLDPGESWEFEQLNKPIITPGLHTNIATITGTPWDFGGTGGGFEIDPDCLAPVTATDPASIIVDQPSVTIVKTVDNDDDCIADITGSGVVDLFHPGDTATYHYAVTNTGTTDLLLTSLQDVNDFGTPANLADDVVFSPTPVLNGAFNVGDANQNGEFDPGETWQFTGQVTFTNLGMHSNVVTVVATPSIGNTPLTGFSTVTATDDLQVYVAQAGVNIEKRVNGKDANVGPFDQIAPGTAVNYTYLVTNTGNVDLSISSLIDDNGTPANLADDFTPAPVLAGAFNLGDANQNNQFDPGETWVFATAGIVHTSLGEHTNIATVVAAPVDFNGVQIDPACLPVQTDSDPATIIVTQPGIDLTKTVTTDCAENIDGSGVQAVSHPGDAVTYTYTINNTGNASLVITLTDVANNGTPLNLADDITTPLIINGVAQPGAQLVGDTNNNGRLDTNETWIVTFTTTLTTLGYNTNVANVLGTAVDANGTPLTQFSNVTDIAMANVYLAATGIDLEKRVNGKDANSQPPAFDHVLAGSGVNYTYLVTNTGNVILSLSNFVDDNGTPANLADDFAPLPKLNGAFNAGDFNQNNKFDPGETWLFEKLGVVLTTTGIHTNSATVTGTPVDFSGVEIDPDCLESVTATDPASIIVDQPGITIVKTVVNDDDCRADVNGIGVIDLFHPASTATYHYAVTNTGTTDLILGTFQDVNDFGTPGNPADDFVFAPIPITNGGFNVGDVNQNGEFDPGETWQFEGDVTFANLGTHSNVVTVVATPSIGNTPLTGFITLTATDDYKVFVAQSAVNVIKFVNGLDANNPAFQHVVGGASVNYTYTVTNTGNVSLSIASFSDDNATPGNLGDDFAPNPVLNGAHNVGDLNNNDRLDPGETWQFTKLNYIIPINTPAGNYTNTATVVANPVDVNGATISPDCVPQASDSDPATVVVDEVPSSISGCVYVDINNNGVKDGNESPIEGVKITLTGTDNQGNVVNQVTFTDQNGNFSFTGLRPSNATGYTLTEQHPFLYVDGKDHAGTSGGVVGSLQPDSDTITGIVLPTGTNATDYCFGEFGYQVPSKRPFIFSNGSWHNESNALDVNADGKVTGLDVLIVIEALNRLGLGQLPTGNGTGNFPDVDADQALTPKDALAIIDQLNKPMQSASGFLADVVFSEMASESSTNTSPVTKTPASTSTTAAASTVTVVDPAASIAAGLTTTPTKKRTALSAIGDLVSQITDKID